MWKWTKILGALLALLSMIALLTTPPAYAADGSSETPKALLDTASWALLAGVLTPLVTSVVQQPQWTGRVRTLVAVIASAVIGVVTLFANGALNDGPQTVLSVVALVVVTSATAYKNLWVPAGVAPAIERATSTTHAPDERGAADLRLFGIIVAAIVVGGLLLILLA